MSKKELTEKMKAYIEGVAAAAQDGDMEIKDLTPDDLAAIAGGLPETFEWNGETMTPEQVYTTVAETEEQYGEYTARRLMMDFARQCIPEANPCVVLSAYVKGGADMWKILSEQGY